MSAHAEVHEALGGFTDEDELIVSWVVVIETAAANGDRYLMHRAGGGFDGEDAPMAWAALGMLRAGARLAEDQVAALTRPIDDEDDGRK